MPNPVITFWRFREIDHGNGEMAFAEAFGFKAKAVDCDGDFSVWEVIDAQGVVIASNPNVYSLVDPEYVYHFDIAKIQADQALHDIVRAKALFLHGDA